MRLAPGGARAGARGGCGAAGGTRELWAPGRDEPPGPAGRWQALEPRSPPLRARLSRCPGWTREAAGSAPPERRAPRVWPAVGRGPSGERVVRPELGRWLAEVGAAGWGRGVGGERAGERGCRRQAALG